MFGAACQPTLGMPVVVVAGIIGLPDWSSERIGRGTACRNKGEPLHVAVI
jgi:hypothetical protein